MTQIERYRHLAQHWKQRLEDAENEVKLAHAEMAKWRNKLYAAEIAEQLPAESAD